MTPEMLNECASIRQACLEEVASLRKEFSKRLGALEERVRIQGVFDREARSELRVEIETFRRDLEWLEDAHEKVVFEGPKAQVELELDSMLRVH